jgi:hypothetical protein
MKTVYSSLLKRLNEKVPSVRWVDIDAGQLEGNGKDRPPIAFPAVLVDIAVTRCRDLTDTIQACEARITLRVAFDPLSIGRTAANAPEDVREAALNPYDVISDIYAALQGFGTQHFDTFSRISGEKEGRSDLFIYKMIFRCEFDDYTAGNGGN